MFEVVCLVFSALTFGVMLFVMVMLYHFMREMCLYIDFYRLQELQEQHNDETLPS